MKQLSFIAIFAFLLASCASTEEKEVSWTDVTVSGEFLFEGPNTLQGQPQVGLDYFAEQLGVNAENIKSASISSATISFEPDSLTETVESVLLQFVSEDLELVSVATKSPVDAQAGEIALEVTEEVDIFPYLKDASTTTVVDVNCSSDLDQLTASLDLKVKISYTN
jgi:hypothetical protein